MAFKSASIRTKLSLLLFTMAFVPLLLIISFFCLMSVASAENNAKKDGMLRNRLVQEHLTQHFEQTLKLLRTIASNPMVARYITSPDTRTGNQTMDLLHDVNIIMGDGDNMVLTDTSAQQIARTDDFPLVNVALRNYFSRGLLGQECVSNALISHASQQLITVVAVPVFNADGSVAGLIQRNYNLAALEAFIKSQADEDTQVLVIDRAGKVIAHSRLQSQEERDAIDLSTLPFISEAFAGASGTTFGWNEQGEKLLMAYSRNELTGWITVSQRKYAPILHKAIREAALAAVAGAVLLAIMAAFAALLAEKATRSLRLLSVKAKKIAEGTIDATSFADLDDNELGQIALAINKIRSSRDSYQKDAETDKLTQLLNKAAMEKRCSALLSQQAGDSMTALLIIDLDHFKNVNDTCGHQTGDQVLQEFAAGLKNLFRPGDCIGRFGGDEFVVLLTDLPGKEIVLQKAWNICAVANSISIPGSSLHVGASIGIATSPLHGSDYASLFSMADTAVYRVKQNGRNGWSYGESEICHWE